MYIPINKKNSDFNNSIIEKTYIKNVKNINKINLLSKNIIKYLEEDLMIWACGDIQNLKSPEEFDENYGYFKLLPKRIFEFTKKINIFYFTLNMNNEIEAINYFCEYITVIINIRHIPFQLQKIWKKTNNLIDNETKKELIKKYELLGKNENFKFLIKKRNEFLKDENSWLNWENNGIFCDIFKKTIVGIIEILKFIEKTLQLDLVLKSSEHNKCHY